MRLSAIVLNLWDEEKAFHGPTVKAKVLEAKTPPSSPFDVLCIGNTARQCMYWLCARLCPLVYTPANCFGTRLHSVYFDSNLVLMFWCLTVVTHLFCYNCGLWRLEL